MGRYYSGDIEGKFWFGVQSSNAADRFGSVGSCHYISYYFDEDHLDDIKQELKNIEEILGEQLALIEDFFSKVNGYNDQTLKDAGIKLDSLSEYADYLLGKKILQCVEENGSCSFDAEL